MHRDAVDTVTDLGVDVWQVVRSQASVDRLPAGPSIVGPKCPGCRNGDEDPTWIDGVEHDRVHAHPSRAGLPRGTGVVRAKSSELGPAGPTVGCAKQRGVF